MDPLSSRGVREKPRWLRTAVHTSSKHNALLEAGSFKVTSGFGNSDRARGISIMNESHTQVPPYLSMTITKWSLSSFRDRRHCVWCDKRHQDLQRTGARHTTSRCPISKTQEALGVLQPGYFQQIKYKKRKGRKANLHMKTVMLKLKEGG